MQDIRALTRDGIPIRRLLAAVAQEIIAISLQGLEPNVHQGHADQKSEHLVGVTTLLFVSTTRDGHLRNTTSRSIAFQSIQPVARI